MQSNKCLFLLPSKTTLSTCTQLTDTLTYTHSPFSLTYLHVRYIYSMATCFLGLYVFCLFICDFLALNLFVMTKIFVIDVVKLCLFALYIYLLLLLFTLFILYIIKIYKSKDYDSYCLCGDDEFRC